MPTDGVKTKAARWLWQRPAWLLVVILMAGCGRSDQAFRVENAGQLKLGDVWITNEYPVKLKLKNVNRSASRITNFRFSCDCVTIDSVQFPLEFAPRETKEILVNVDFSRFAVAVNSKPVNFSVGVAIEDENGNVLPADITATIKSPLSLSVPYLTMGWNLVRGQPFEKTIEVVTLRKGDSVSIVDKSDAFQATVKGNGSERYIIAVSTDSSASCDSYQEVIELRSAMTGAVVPIEIMGRVTPKVTAVPEQLTLGPVAVGTPVKAQVVLQSATEESFQVVEWRWQDAEDVSWQVSFRDHGGDTPVVVVEVEIVPRSIGTIERTLQMSVSVDRGEAEVVELPVMLTVVGD